MAHLHFHCCLIDGVFAAEGDGVHFLEATGLDAGMVTALQRAVREPVLELFEKEGLLDDQSAANMRTWSHGGGFSRLSRSLANRGQMRPAPSLSIRWS